MDNERALAESEKMVEQIRVLFESEKKDKLEKEKVLALVEMIMIEMKKIVAESDIKLEAAVAKTRLEERRAHSEKMKELEAQSRLDEEEQTARATSEKEKLKEALRKHKAIIAEKDAFIQSIQGQRMEEIDNNNRDIEVLFAAAVTKFNQVLGLKDEEIAHLHSLHYATKPSIEGGKSECEYNVGTEDDVAEANINTAGIKRLLDTTDKEL